MPKSKPPLAIATLDTPIGPIRVAAHARGLARVLFDTQKNEVLEEDPNPSNEAKQHLEAALQALREYFADERQSFDDLTLAPEGTDFQLSVWHALLNIGYGDTCAYRDIATTIGNPNAVSVVWPSNGRNESGRETGRERR